jgi:putative copper resistance protein D
VNAWFLVGSITALTVSDYGRLLMVKVALFVVMLCFAAVNRLYLTPRLADRNSNASAALARNSLAEAALGLIVIIVVAVLGTLAPAHEELHLHHVDAAHRAQSPPPPQQRSIVYRSECGESSCPRDERCS